MDKDIIKIGDMYLQRAQARHNKEKQEIIELFVTLGALYERNVNQPITKTLELVREELETKAQVNIDNLIENQKQKEIDNMPRPLKYGQGSITERHRQNKNGSVYKWYEARWLDEFGRRQVHTCKTKEEARGILAKYNKRSMRNCNRKQIKLFGTSFKEWYETFGSKNTCEKRKESDRLQISRIPKNIMSKPLKMVTAQELQTYIDSVDKKHGEHPRWWIYNLLKAFLKFAFNAGYIKSNYGALLQSDRPLPQRKKNILPRELEDKFLSLIPEKYRKYAIGLIYTGCRISEFMDIQKEDVDKEKGIIRIRETKSVREKERKHGITYHVREIPILPQIENFTFPMKKLIPGHLQRIFKKASAELGLKLTPHDMRHTYKSRCNELGIAESVSMAILGHKTISMAQHYTHNTTELLNREYEKIRKGTPKSTPIQDDEQ